MPFLAKIISGGPGLLIAFALCLIGINARLINQPKSCSSTCYLFLWRCIFLLLQYSANIVRKRQFLNSPTGPSLPSAFYSSGGLPVVKSNRPDVFAFLSGSAKKAGFLLGIFVLLSFANASAATITSTRAGGNWNNPATWVGGVVPSTGDDVTIASGATVVIDSDAVVGTLTVSGILQYDSTVAYALTVTEFITVNAEGVFRSAQSGSIKNHRLIAHGSIINNGTIDFSSNANETGVELVFTGPGNAIFNCSDAIQTNLRQGNGIILNKGKSAASVLSFIPGKAFRVLSDGSTNAKGFLTIENGTFNVIGSRNFRNPVFSADGTYTIPATGGLWLGNQNAEITGLNGDVIIQGELKITNGIFNAGNSGENSLITEGNGLLKISGGVVNVAGKLTADGGVCSISDGTLNLAMHPNSANNEPTLGVSSKAKLEIFGNPLVTITYPNSVKQLANDIQILEGSGMKFISGGAIQLGTEATPAQSIFLVSGERIIPYLTAFHECSTIAYNTSGKDVTTTPVTTLPLIALDKTAPEITAPSKITIKCGETLPTAYTSLSEFTKSGGVVSDNCALNPSGFKMVKEVRSKAYCPYIITRTYEIADASGNTATAEQQIQVEGNIAEPKAEPVSGEPIAQELKLKSAMAYASSVTFSSNGSFVVPAGVTTVQVECWGGGGKGGSTTSDGTETGGGGGGAYSSSSLGVTPGTSYTVNVGLGSTTASPGGDSWFGTTLTILAKGGNSVANNTATGATGGAALSGFGTTRLSGGNGATGNSGSYGGGGGSSAGTGLAGVNATNQNGAAAPAGGGNGGNGKSGSNGNGTAGSVPGGGGGGVVSGNSTSYSGGSGANGKVIVSYTCPDYSLTSIAASAVCIGGFSTITLNSSAAELPTGTYTVTYNLSAPNAATGLAKLVTVTTAGTGTFNTGTLGSSGATGITITNLASGTCSSPISSGNTANIAVDPTSVGGTSSPTTQTICSGTSPANITLSGNTGAIQWQSSSDNVTYSNISGATSATLTSAQMGTQTAVKYYRAIVTSGVCSTATSTVATVSIYSTLIPGAHNTNAITVCEGYSYDMLWFTTAPSGGNPPYTYQWRLNGSNIPGATGNTYTPTITGTGTFNINCVVTDACGTSSSTVSKTITVIPDATANITGATSVCQNGSLTLTANTTGGTGTFTYDWQKSLDGGATWTSTGSTNSTFSVPSSVAGTFYYRVKVKVSGAACNDPISAPVTITVYPTPTVNAIANQIYCNNQTVPQTSLTGTVTGTTFTWTNSNTAIGLAPNGTGNVPSFTATNATGSPINATITITPTANGCVGPNQTYTITVNPTPTVNDPIDQVLCNSAVTALVNFTGTATAFNWTNNNTNIGLAASGTGNIASFTATNTGNTIQTATITVTPVYSNGGVDCSGTAQTFTITVNPTPSVAATPLAQTICPGSSIAQIDITNPNNVTGTSFSWTRNNTVNLTGIAASGSGNSITGILNSATPGVLQTTTFTIMATANGCSSQTTVAVTVGDNTPPSLSCPANIPAFTSGSNCSQSVVTPDPVFSDNCQMNKLTWAMTGATVSNSSATGINLVGTYVFNSGVTTITYTATDAGGNTANCAFSVTVTDNVGPVLSCPGPITVNNSPGFCYATAASVNLVNATATDNCNPSPTVTGVRSDAQALNASYPVGVTIITWTASDGSNISTCTQTVTVVDNEKPNFTSPADITIYTDASCNSNRTPAFTGDVPVASKTDNCTPNVNLIPVYSDAANIPGSCIGSYSFVRTWSLTDGNGNTTTKTQNITVSDNVKPSLTVPPNITIKCSDSQDPDINTVLGKATSTDNCTPVGSISITYSDAKTPGICDTRYTIARTWKATDACGNVRTDTQTIIVSDTEGPVVVVPELTASCPSDLSTTRKPYTTIAQFITDGGTATDLCGPVTISILFEDEISYGLANKPGYCPDYVVRTYRFTDPCGNYVDKTQTVTVQGECGCSPCDAATRFEWVDFLGDPDGTKTFSGVTRTGKCCADDEWWSEPGAGQLRCVSFNVRIDDDAVGVQITFEAGATPDIKDWRVDCQEVTLQPGGIICLPTGGFHLFTYCKQGNNPNDITFQSVPGIIVSDDMTTRIDCQGQINTEGSFTNPQWTSISPGAQGAWNNFLYNPLTMVPGSGVNVADPIFIAGPGAPAEIKYKICADLGVSVCNQFGSNCDTISVYVKEKVDIQLNIDPSLICVNDPLDLVANVTPASSFYTWEWHVGTGATGTIISTTNTVHLTPPIAPGTWYSVKVIDHDPTGTMCNEDIYDFQVQADITGALVFSPPSGDLTIECNGPGAVQAINDWLATATAKDDDGTPLVVTNNYSGITQACGTNQSVTFTAEDNCHNIGTATATIHVVDTTPPVISQQAIGGSSVCSTPDPNSNPGYMAWLANHGGALATDACDPTLVWADNHLTQAWSGNSANNQITVAFTVTDDCNNTSQTTATYTITDNVPPTITCPGNIIETANLNNCSKILVSPSTPTYNDNCSTPVLAYSLTGATSGSGNSDVTTSGVSFNVGVTTVTYTVTDAAGLSANCSFTVTIIDINPPVFTMPCPLPDINAVAAPGTCSAPIIITSPVVTDPCNEPITLTNSFNNTNNASGTYPIGTTVITWTATDVSGNVRTCVQTVTVIDTQTPTITCQGDVEDFIVGSNCDLISSKLTDPTINDNCPPPSLTYHLVFENGTTVDGTGTVTNYLFPVGKTQVTYTVTDASTNSATCTFQVWIKNLDKPKFAVTCPTGSNQNLVVPAETGKCDASVTVPAPDISNLCNEVFSVTYNGTPVPATLPLQPVTARFVIGTTTVTWVVTDASSNTTTCTQFITVVDTQTPTITCPTSFTVQADLNKSYATKVDVPLPTNIGDNCTYTLTWTITGATTDTSTNNTGESFVPSPYPQLNLGDNIIAYTITDGTNTVTCSFIITVRGIPEIDCPAAVTTSTDSGVCSKKLDPGVPVLKPGSPPADSWSWVMTGATTGSGGNNGSSPSPVNPNPFLFNVGVTTITWTACNISGCGTCTQEITVEDKEPPTFTPATITECVDMLYSAVYTATSPNPISGVDPNLIINPSPDYYTFKSGDTSLDLTVLDDNCCGTASLTVNWRIAFAPVPDPLNPTGPKLTHADITGTGQPSAYGSDILIWGDGVNYTIVTHSIFYWVEDCHGNKSEEQHGEINITPRPQIIKMN